MSTRRLRSSVEKLTCCHILPSERAVVLLERFFANGQPMSRVDLLNNVLAVIKWDDEMVLVRPLKMWVDRFLTLLCSGGYLRRVHDINGMSYVPTERWAERDEMLIRFQHPTRGKRVAPEPVLPRKQDGGHPSDAVINMREWAEVRANRRAKWPGAPLS